LAFLVGSIAGALQSGKLILTISADYATVIVAIAETIVAILLLPTAATEVSAFLWKKKDNTMNVSMKY
jgi:hypothetical protein